MAREAFQVKEFHRKHVHVIAEANKILKEYFAAGFTMTLRQLHYQFVARKIMLEPDRIGEDKVPYANTDKSYDMLGKVLTEARFCGLVDWSHMEDRLRSLERITRWSSPSAIVNAVAEQYQEDLWTDHKYRPEVWIEKDALAGVIEGICEELRVDYFACRGYVSASAHYQASQRWRQYRANKQEPIIFHLGDHDPSGLDMTRENGAKFALLMGKPVKIVRLALNFDQVEQYDPPPNPAKMSDVRAPGYVAEYGTDSWELDALEPQVISDLIRDAVTPVIQPKQRKANQASEDSNRERLRLVSKHWDNVVGFVEEFDGSDDDTSEED